MENEFIIIPKKIILDGDFSKDYDCKTPYVIAYLMCCCNKIGKCYFSLEDLIIKSGCKPKTGNNKTNERFRKIISGLVKEGILNLDVDISTVNINYLVRCDLNIPYELNKNSQRVNWFSLSVNNYLKILESENELNKFTLTNIYFYILARIYRRNDSINNIRITGGTAEVFWSSQNSIGKDLNLAKVTLNAYLAYLKSLNLIYYGNIGKIEKDNSIIEANNVYATNKEELKDGLKQSKYYWENQGWELVNK